MQQELDEWVAMITSEPDAGEEDVLHTLLKDVEAERMDWEIHAELKDWDESSPTLERKDKEESGMLRQMFFGNMFGRRTSGGSK